MLLHYKASFEIQTSSCTGFYTPCLSHETFTTRSLFIIKPKNPEISAQSQAKKIRLDLDCRLPPEQFEVERINIGNSLPFAKIPVSEFPISR